MSVRAFNRREFFKNAAVTSATVAGCGVAAGVLSTGDEAAAAPLRPPGALPEDDFLATCIRCMRCVDACPNNAILPLDDAFGRHRCNTPAIKARRQACMLCNRIEGDYLKCTQACPSGALQLIRNDPDEIRQKVSMGKAQIDLDLCYSYNNWTCGACASACPLQGTALTRGMWERPEVNTDACLGCGLCERSCIRCLRCVEACPNNAILSLDDSFGRHLRNTPAIKARRQACMLCNQIDGEFLKCTGACPSGALQPIRNNPEEICQKVSMGTAEIDLDLCYSYNSWTCGACASACPLEGTALSRGMWERPEVNAEACLGCGLCERSCIRYPQAIRVKPKGA
jgi:ferredoxin-type protein NapG